MLWLSRQSPCTGTTVFFSIKVFRRASTPGQRYFFGDQKYSQRWAELPGDISNTGPNARTQIAPIGPGGQKLPTIEPAAQKCAFQLHFQSLPTLLCLFSRGAKYSMCHKYLTWLEKDRDPCQLSPIGVRIRSLIQPAIIARHPTCGRDTPICAGIHYVPIQIWTSYLSSHILTMRRHRFSNHLWQVLAGDSLGTFDPPDIFAA